MEIDRILSWVDLRSSSIRTDHLVRILQDTSSQNCTRPVTVLSLDVICLEHSGNIAMPGIQEIFCDQMTSPRQSSISTWGLSSIWSKQP